MATKKKATPKGEVSTPKKKKAVKATKALTKKFKDKKVEVLGPDPLEQISTKLSTMDKTESLKTAKELMENIDQNYFELGGLLAAIQENQWYEEGGHENLRVFVETELGTPYRKAMYLINIYNHIVDSGIPYEKIKGIGWTKLKEIAGIMDADNVDDLVSKAKNMNTLQLIEEVKAMGVEGKEEMGTGESNPIKSKVFKLHTDQREVIEEALEDAKLKCNTEHDAVALEHICMEYMNKSVKPKTVKEAKKKVVAKKVAKEPVPIEPEPEDSEFEEEDVFA